MYDATGTQGTNAQMVYTCPHCQGRFEFNTESLVRQIFCPLCGQGFDPVKIETMRYPEGTPVSPSPGAAPETIQVANKDERLRVGTLLGQFRIDEFIGRGGMGAVYKATQTSLDRAVALKVLPRHMAEDPEFVQRFHREAKALAELNHPNIVSIYDKGNEEGQYFFAMEFVEGVSLRQLIKSKTVSPSQALALVPQLCEALEYAHSRGVIHRDIKPENILVDRSGRVKIADFGLARIIRGDDQTTFNGLTRSDVMMGTVNYMAPEQRENAKDVDHRADIYSLGVVIYELLTGDLPIGRFAAPSKKVQIDVRLDEVVLQLLERDREDRYQNVSDVKTGFARAMTGPAAPVEREARKAAVAAPRASGIGALAFTLLGSLLLTGAAVLATVQLVGEIAHPWPFAWGTNEVQVLEGGWDRLSSIKEVSTQYWLYRHQTVYWTLAAAGLGLLALSFRLRTRSGSPIGWIGSFAFLGVAAGAAALVGTSAIEARDWIARLVAALAPSVGLAAFGGLWVAARRSERGLYGIERELESPVDRWAMRVFQAGCVLWIVGAILTSKVGLGRTTSAVGGVLATLGAPVVFLGLMAVRRIGGSEDGRTGLRYAIAGALASAVFPAMLLSDGAETLDRLGLYRYMEATFLSGWLFVAFAIFDAAFRPSQRLGKYFGLGGALERRAWVATILGTASVGALLIAFDYRTVNRGDNVLLAATPFVGAIAYIFLVAWGIPLPASGKECESECPILDKGVSIEANCPSGAGVSIHLGTSAPPVPSTPPTSAPPAPPAAATVPGIPIAEEIKAQVRAAIAEIPSAEEIKAQVRASLAASGIPVAQAAPAPSEKALRKGWNKTRSMWRDAFWHVGAYAIVAGGFALAGKWGWWLFFWGCIVGGQLLSTLFRTIADPPHRPATTPQAQKRRKELSGFLQHLSWFAAITTAFSYPGWQFPWWGPWWGIGLAFHFLSTVLDVAFGKDAA